MRLFGGCRPKKTPPQPPQKFPKPANQHFQLPSNWDFQFLPVYCQCRLEIEIYIRSDVPCGTDAAHCLRRDGIAAIPMLLGKAAEVMRSLTSGGTAVDRLCRVVSALARKGSVENLC